MKKTPNNPNLGVRLAPDIHRLFQATAYKAAGTDYPSEVNHSGFARGVLDEYVQGRAAEFPGGEAGLLEHLRQGEIRELQAKLDELYAQQPPEVQQPPEAEAQQ